MLCPMQPAPPGARRARTESYLTPGRLNRFALPSCQKASAISPFHACASLYDCMIWATTSATAGNWGLWAVTYWLSFVEGPIEKDKANPYQPYGSGHTEPFASEATALRRAEEVLRDPRFHTVSLNDGEKMLNEPRLRLRLGLPPMAAAS